MSKITVESFMSGVESMLRFTTDLCMNSEALAEWIKGGYKKNPDNGRDFKKITKEITQALNDKQAYYRKKIKALKASQGNKKQEQALETAIKIIEPGTSEMKIETYIARFDNRLRLITGLCLGADELAKWVKGGCKEKPANDKYFKKIVAEIIKFLRRLETYYIEVIEALEIAQKNKKLKQAFETSIEIFNEDKRRKK